MRIAVDARSLTTRPTGVGQYLMAAVNVWAERNSTHEFLLLAHKPLHAAARLALRDCSRIRYLCRPAPLLSGNGLAWLVTEFERSARGFGADLLWGAGGLLPPFARMPTLLTVHDLVYRSLPQTLSRRNRLAYGLLAGRSIRRADWIWAVSQFTAGEVARHYPKRKAIGMVVGSGLNPLRAQHVIGSEQLALLEQRYRLGSRSLLFVGTLEPRKNLGFLLSLMPTLARRGFNLIVVGCSGWGRSGMAERVHGADFPRDAVQFCDYVSDIDLQGLYRSAALFVSTSLMEGFGLPQLEAMAAGCPVVAAANSGVVEVVGEGGLLVTGWHAEDWISAIETAFELRPALRLKSLAQATAHDIGTACDAFDAALSAQWASPA